MKRLPFDQREARLAEEQRKVLDDYLDADARPVVLDIGCANFREYSLHLQSIAGHYIGLELDEYYVREIATKGQSSSVDVHLINASAERIPLADASVDLVVMNDMLAYCNKEDVVTEVARVLKSNGLAVSLHNNSIGWSLYKMVYTEKPILVEWLHSLLVIGNTFLYRLVGIRMFHTTFNTHHEIENLMRYRGLFIERSWATAEAYTWYHVVARKV